jgi:4-hydroxy-3-methylbut-2-enyl diphosphate reductase
MIVVGSPNSSNSQRLREVAEREGCPVVRLILRAEDIDWSLFGNIRSLGITAGASAPEILVEEIIDAFAERYEVSVESVSTADESVFFPLPRELREQAAE